MSNVVNLQPPLTTPKVKEIGGELCVNVPGIMKMAREGDSPQCRSLVRFYSAEWRALEGKPFSAEQREVQAFMAAWKRMAHKFGSAHIDWSGLSPSDRS